MLKLVLSLISPRGEVRLLTHLIGEGHLSISGWGRVSQRNSTASELPVQARQCGVLVTWGSSQGLDDAAAIPGISGGNDLTADRHSGLTSVKTSELVFGCWEFDSFHKLGHKSGVFLFSSE